MQTAPKCAKHVPLNVTAAQVLQYVLRVSPPQTFPTFIITGAMEVVSQASAL